jgi:hypothetical protein
VSKRVVRWVVAAAVGAAVALVVPGVSPAGAAAASTATVSPTQAKPGGAFTFKGRAPSCPNMPFQVTQVYSNNKGEFVSTSAPGGKSNASGEFGPITLSVPATASRSNAYRPYAAMRYDAVRADFSPACPDGTVGANLTVLAMRFDQHIEVNPAVPRTGENIDVTVTNCVGGVLAAFTWIIDNAGSYFMFTQSSYTANIYNGTADLSKGFRGDKFKTGAAHVSQPVGVTDAALQVPCAQSEGPDSVGKADHLFHLNNTIDITIAPATGPLPHPYPPAPEKRRSTSVTTFHETTTVSGDVVPSASVADPVSGSPTFVG